jgi:hypothetical protein
MSAEQTFVETMQARREPIVRFVEVIKRINDIEFKAVPAAAGLREQVLAISMRELTPKAIQLHDEGCGWLRFGALADRYQFDLRSAIVAALPKPITARSEVEAHIGEFQRKRWNGFETDGVVSLLRPEGEKVLEVGFWEVRTSERTLKRGDLDALRPSTFTSDSGWRKSFTSSSEISAAEANESAETEAAKYPPYWDSYNRDQFPGGVRPK